MQDLPVGFDAGALLPALAEGWGIAADSVDYAAVGYGSYHWLASGEDHRRYFVTVDDLDHKAWLGDTREAAFVGLGAAFETAVALRGQGGLELVVAPLPTVRGEAVRRSGRQHSIAVFPFFDGEAGHFGDHTTAEHRADVVEMLVELHQDTPGVLHVAPRRELDFAGRAGLEVALKDLDRAWRGGPFAEPARALLASHERVLLRRFDEFDQLVRAVAASDAARVVTHGEPHPGNIMRGNDKLVLIDWDTVGLAPPERDLWLVADESGDEAARYADATGHQVSGRALSLYRQAWALADIAAYLDLFRSPHQRRQDTEDAWLNLESTVRLEL